MIGQTKKLLNRLNRVRRRTSDGWMINVFVVFSVVFFIVGEGGWGHLRWFHSRKMKIMEPSRVKKTSISLILS